MASASTPAAKDITWVFIQDPGNATHQRQRAPSLVHAKKAIIRGYEQEQIVGNVDRRRDSSAADPPSPALYHYYSNHMANVQLYPAGHGFFEACHSAWAYHGSLVLSPDDVWLAIQTIFAKYMRLNAEALRSMFVAHDGQKELIVQMDDAPGDWQLFMDRVVTQVTANSKLDMQVFVPPFSSSTPFDSSMKHLAVMDHMQQYFQYRYSTSCGVRRVGLHGKLDDWLMLRTYIEGLAQFEVPHGAKDEYFTFPERTYASGLQDLLSIADQLIATYQGEVDVEWWNSMVNERSTQGSGSSTFVKGWLLALISNRAIDRDMRIQDVQTMRFSVPVKREHNEKITRMRILGGFTGAQYDATNNVWSAQRSMAVMDDKLFKGTATKTTHTEHGL
jgi:hypothetical protein